MVSRSVLIQFQGKKAVALRLTGRRAMCLAMWGSLRRLVKVFVFLFLLSWVTSTGSCVHVGSVGITARCVQIFSWSSGSTNCASVGGANYCRTTCCVRCFAFGGVAAGLLRIIGLEIWRVKVWKVQGKRKKE